MSTLISPDVSQDPEKRIEDLSYLARQAEYFIRNTHDNPSLDAVRNQLIVMGVVARLETEFGNELQTKKLGYQANGETIQESVNRTKHLFSEDTFQAIEKMRQEAAEMASVNTGESIRPVEPKGEERLTDEEKGFLADIAIAFDSNKNNEIEELYDTFDVLSTPRDKKVIEVGPDGKKSYPASIKLKDLDAFSKELRTAGRSHIEEIFKLWLAYKYATSVIAPDWKEPLRLEN